MRAPLAERIELFLQGGGVGHEPGRRGQPGDVEGRDIAADARARRADVLGVDHADDVVRLAAPQRHAGIGAGEDLRHQFARGQTGVQGGHVAAVGHDLADLDVTRSRIAAASCRDAPP